MASDLVGLRFGRLAVSGRAENSAAGHARWTCQCDCGESSVVEGKKLRTGLTVSCGCHRAAATAARSLRHGHAHAGNLSPEYQSWAAMIGRCSNPALARNRHYAGRGIVVCEAWRSFPAFLADMGPRPDGTSLDRIDVNGNYEPGNCRWATRSEQRANQRPVLT